MQTLKWIHKYIHSGYQPNIMMLSYGLYTSPKLKQVHKAMESCSSYTTLFHVIAIITNSSPVFCLIWSKKGPPDLFFLTKCGQLQLWTKASGKPMCRGVSVEPSWGHLKQLLPLIAIAAIPSRVKAGKNAHQLSQNKTKQRKNMALGQFSCCIFKSIMQWVFQKKKKAAQSTNFWLKIKK